MTLFRFNRLINHIHIKVAPARTSFSANEKIFVERVECWLWVFAKNRSDLKFYDSEVSEIIKFRAWYCFDKEKLKKKIKISK